MTSGIVLNPDIYWISYHGSYDFGYLLKLLTNENIPKIEDEFIKQLSLYFNNYYDVKILVKDLDYYFNGGLNKLIYKLGVSRKGEMHQAGSDSIATIESFFTLKKFNIANKEKLEKFKNVLYGIGIGQDNENTIHYTNCSNQNNNQQMSQPMNNINNNSSINQLNNNIYYPNLKQQINNCTNTNIKWFCPVVLVNPYGMINRNALSNSFNNQVKNMNELVV